jgi:hypothetical protein
LGPFAASFAPAASQCLLFNAFLRCVLALLIEVFCGESRTTPCSAFVPAFVAILLLLLLFWTI